MDATGVERLTAGYNRGPAVLHDVTLLAEPGELFVVVGPSGSGKSTLLRVMAGMTQATAGTVLIAGVAVNDLPPQQRDVAMVFESSALLPFLTVADNLGFGLTIRHTPRTEIEHRVGEQARGFRLTGLLGRKPPTLSAGEHGQVGIGRALMRTPRVFLLDEPLSHHDAAERLRMRRQISDTVRRTGVTTFYVTHDQTEALAIADRMAVLRAGRIAAIGTPRELYDRPPDLFVADFLGAVPLGLLPARLVMGDGQAGFQVGARTLPLWTSVPAGLLAVQGHEVLLGFREEDVLPAAESADPGRVELPGRVVGVDYTGPHAVVTAEIAAPAPRHPDQPGPATSTRAVLRARFPARTFPRIGDTVQLTLDAGRAHVFDAETGVALQHP
jgi:multiple sugar transport system ATP-binding protein